MERIPSMLTIIENPQSRSVKFTHFRRAGLTQTTQAVMSPRRVRGWKYSRPALAENDRGDRPGGVPTARDGKSPSLTRCGTLRL